MSKGLELLYDAFDSVASNLIPAADNAYDIGSDSLRWKDVHVYNGVRLGTVPFVLRANPSDSGRLELVDGAGNYTQLRLGRILGERITGGLTTFEFNTVSNSGSLSLNSAGHLGFSSSLSASVNGSDTRLVRKAAGVLGVYSGATLGTNPGGFQFGNHTQMSAATDGNLLLQDNAGTDFGLLQFGGTTSSFPALKRNGAGLEVRTADDSTGGLLTSVGLRHTSNGYDLSSSTGLFAFASPYVITWSSTSSYGGAKDLGLRRSAAGVLQVSGGSAASAASLELFESASAPAAPAANGVRIYAKDVGTKTALFARFESGAEVQIAIDP